MKERLEEAKLQAEAAAGQAPRSAGIPEKEEEDLFTGAEAKAAKGQARWQVSGPQPICGPLVGHFSEWGKTDTFSLYKECLRHSFDSI